MNNVTTHDKSSKFPPLSMLYAAQNREGTTIGPVPWPLTIPLPSLPEFLPLAKS